jgi:glycosyltransferase domain-containing protein
MVVPTYQRRSALLARALRYYSEVRFPYPIVIADASEAAAREQNSGLVAEFQTSLEIQHRTYPSDCDFFVKILDALDSVETEYVVLCGDDDFLVPEAAEACVRFLESNPDFVAADGQDIRLMVPDAEHRDIEPECITRPRASIESDLPLVRLQQHFARYWSTFYAVHRRSVFAHSFQGASEHAANVLFSELMQSGLTVIQGKYKHLHTLYSVRPTSSADRGQLPDWHWITPGAASPADTTAFCQALARALGPEVGSLDEREQLVRRSFQQYLRAVKKWMKQVQTHDSLRAKLRWVLSLLPVAIWHAVSHGRVLEAIRSPRNFLRRCSAEREEKKRRGREEPWSLSILRQPDSESYEQFAPIFEHLERWPEGVPDGANR